MHESIDKKWVTDKCMNQDRQTDQKVWREWMNEHNKNEEWLIKNGWIKEWIRKGSELRLIKKMNSERMNKWKKERIEDE